VESLGEPGAVERTLLIRLPPSRGAEEDRCRFSLVT
jgi:hypothetical protein